jgi:exosortase/archaeosortase family protein
MLRALAFPTALLLMLSIPPLQIAYSAGAMLSNIGSQISYTILKFFGMPVDLTYAQGSPIIALYSSSGLPIEFAIEVACSGLYSLLGFTVFTVFASYIIRGAFWKKTIVLLIGFPLIFTLNISRIILIVLIGYWFGQGAAMSVFHIFGGWALVFVGTLFLLFFSEKIFKLKIFSPKTKLTSCPHCEKSLEDNQNFCLSCGKLLRFPRVKASKQETIKIAALILSVFLIASIQVPVFATTHGPAEVVLQTPYGSETTQILPKISGYTLKFMYRDKNYESSYGLDAALTYAYIPQNGSPIVWTTLEISKVWAHLHSWEGCYAIYVQQGRFAVLDQKDIHLSQNPLIIGRFYSIQVVGHNFTETVLYWSVRTVFDGEWKYVKISVFVDVYHTDYAKVEEELLPFGKAIVEYWQPIQSWPLAAIAISRHQSILMPIPIALLLFVSILNVSRKWRDKRLNLKIYDKLVSDDKLVFQAVHKAAKEGKPTTSAIASAYQKLSGNPIEHSKLLEKLKSAEEAGLIEESIASYDDNPVLIWRSQIPNVEE